MNELNIENNFNILKIMNDCEIYRKIYQIKLNIN